MNLVIKEEQHHRSLDIRTFLENIKEKVFEQQKGEMIKTVYHSGEYRLCEEMQHLSVAPYDWQQMNEDQRKALLKKIFSSDVENIQRKSFDVGRPLSVSFEDPSICMNLPVTILCQLWNKAEFVYENCSISFFISIQNITTKVTFYYTLNNCATLQDDAMGAKINDNTTAIT